MKPSVVLLLIVLSACSTSHEPIAQYKLLPVSHASQQSQDDDVLIISNLTTTLSHAALTVF